ncbi:hypothetical protein ALC62_03699 [Cyphomyrmex costatus]|uniref:Uncharacterized protein n=1 Tax=Cyphomyrmex costatus TaxID=456900 RepID=A0A195CZ60_9HYME|nr:hypothetical protein ALC62_03699 [Cyphomyrmex costatus]
MLPFDLYILSNTYYRQSQRFFEISQNLPLIPQTLTLPQGLDHQIVLVLVQMINSGRIKIQFLFQCSNSDGTYKYLPPNSTSGDNKPPDELLLVIETPAVSVSLVSIDGVFPILYTLLAYKQFTKLEPYLLKERVVVGILMGDNRNGSSNNSAAVALISGFGSKQPACGEPSSMNGGLPVAISTIVQPKDQMSA